MRDIKYNTYSSLRFVGSTIRGLSLCALFLVLSPLILSVRLYQNFFQKEAYRYKREHPGG